MTNIFQRFITGLVFVLFIGFVASCDKQPSFNIFNQKIETNSSPQYSGHDMRFLEVTGLSNLDYIIVDGVSVGAMSKISQILLPTQVSPLDPDKMVFVYIYTTNSKNPVISISRSETHAFSVVSVGKDSLNHTYYEKQPDSSFRQVLSLPKILDGPLNMDEIRMLHFAAIKGSQLPEKSSIFEFRSMLFKNLKFNNTPNKSLMKSLLMDLTRNKGSQTIGLYGDALYSALRADDKPGTGSCGNVVSCPPGGDGNCVPVDSRDGAGYMCQVGNGGGGGGCTAAQLPALSQVMGFSLTTPVAFRSIHSFRDKFLAKSDVGKEYVSYMYVFSLFAKMDIKSLTKYASIIGPLQASINTIMLDGKTGVVVTEDLKRQAKIIINSHKDVEDKDFQNILTRMELDLDRLAGMKKNDFIREFEGRTTKVNK